ncbi:hypothetical protein LF599_00245 [Pseudodesulfovibrio thermohalotolerans]|uniref:hypothetical protein n=1 Tax=Pseudodesulfovibrio thermohalotolerans TaxID=2880651 RepID=UPI0024411739|nr:hypothetical protein [Pseudodesulfovibrio thermohalotolerans]WFS62621.1 hypothetical protein LF599_00245 [Pseudodesulfovibrio thermohalotolerans]
MRTLLLALMLALALTACSSKDEAAQLPVPDEAPAARESAAPSNGQPVSSLAITETIPEGPIGQIQLTNGSTLVIDGLEKLGNYWIYISGKLNGRSSTVISLTRFRDLMSWQSIVFKDPHTFTITNNRGKEWAFEDANLYLGSEQPGTYAFYVLDDRYERKLTEVKKSEVANISFKTN